MNTDDDSYVLKPQVDSKDGDPRVVYYVAHSKKRHRPEFAVGPSAVDSFLDGARQHLIAGVNLWDYAAGTYYGFSGKNTEWQRLSAVFMHFAMRGDWSRAWEALKAADIKAAKDPSWWAWILSTLAGGFTRGGTAGTAATTVVDAAAGVEEQALARVFTEALETGKAPAVVNVGDVEFHGIQVAREGEELVLRRFGTVNTATHYLDEFGMVHKRPPGDPALAAARPEKGGGAMNAAYERAAVQVARDSGAKVAKIELNTIVNTNEWLPTLRRNGYEPEQTPSGQSVWVKRIPVN